MSSFKISPFFPDKNLNPQGWVTDFITSRLQRDEKTRSDLANLIYDEKLTPETITSFPALSGSLQKEIEQARQRSVNDKSIYLNPKYYDAVEKNTSISAKVVEDEKKMRDYYRYMINIKSNELASFVPYVHVKYGYKEANEKNFTEVEVPFVQNLKNEVASILADKFSRGQGAGIKSITANRSFPGLGLTLNIDVNISYFFSSISLLTRVISNDFIKSDKKFSYSKLFSFLRSKRERLVLEYGYGVNNQDTNISYGKKNDIVNMEKKRIVLAYKGHKINIQEDGTILVDVNYLAQSEAQLFQKNDVSVPNLDFLNKASYLTPPQKSILEKYNQLNVEYLQKQELIQNYEENLLELKQIGNNKSSKDIKSIEKLKEALKKELEKTSKNITSLKTQTAPFLREIFIKELVKRRQMFQVYFTATPDSKKEEFLIETVLGLQTEEKVIEMKKFSTVESLSNYQKLFKKEPLQDDNLTPENLYKSILINLFDGIERTTSGKPFGHTLFFPLRALISIIYDLLDPKTSPFPTPYMCLGNITARSFGREYALNIGDVLVESETFAKWLYKNFDQRTRIEYSLSAIMKDIMEELVPEAISRNNTGFYSKNSIGAIRHLVYYTTNPDKALIREVYKKQVDFNKLRNIFTPEYSKEAEPMIYYTQMLSPLNGYTSPFHRKYIAKRVMSNNAFDLDQDSQLGIPHVSIGASKGVIKKTSFNAIEQPGLATSLVMQSMADGNTRLPRYAYNVEVEMFGNNLFSQAGFLAVPPFGVENGVDVSLGITGYYVITKVADSIGDSNVYSTKVSAIFHDNPLDNKRKGTIATTKQNNTNKEGLSEYITFTVGDYIKDLLELDPTTLKSLGITAQKEVKTEKPEEEKKNENKKKPRRDKPK
jgi:hypothetical protein